MTSSAQPLRPDLLPPEGAAPFPRLRMERVARGARFFPRMGGDYLAGASLAEAMAGNAHVDGPRRLFSASMDRMALHAAGKGSTPALFAPAAVERMATVSGRIDRGVATVTKGAPGLSKEGFAGSAVGHMTIRAPRVPDPPRVKGPWFHGVIRVASGADGAPPLPQGNARPGENSPPPLYVRGVARDARSPSPLSRRQGGVLRPLPKDRAAVLYGSVVATVADPLLNERFLLLGREKGGIEKDAFPDVAERTVLLVEGGT